jgi:hypothetical protein
VRDVGFDRLRVLVCGFFPGPKCSGGLSADSAVAVASGGYCGLLSSSTSPWEGVGLTSLCRGAGVLSKVSQLSFLSLGSGRGEPKRSPSHYRRLRPELWFILLFIIESALDGASDKNLS